jgi:hypothetical protein
MRSLVALAPFALLFPYGAGAQSPQPEMSSAWAVAIGDSGKIAPSRPGFSLPIVTYTEPDGALRMRKGIIAGKQVAPDTVLGVGLFESSPKARPLLAPENPMERRQRRSRNAAVGLKISF